MQAFLLSSQNYSKRQSAKCDYTLFELWLSGCRVVELLFFTGSRIYINQINSTSLAIRHPGSGMSGCRIRTRHLPQNAGSRTYINEINSTTRQPYIARIACQHEISKYGMGIGFSISGSSSPDESRIYTDTGVYEIPII